jgi:hypothetical protein
VEEPEPSSPAIERTPLPDGSQVEGVEEERTVMPAAESPSAAVSREALAPARDLRDAAAGAVVPPGSLGSTARSAISEVWREKLDAGIRASFILGAFGGAALPFSAAASRLSGAVQQGGLGRFLGVAIVSGGCVLLSAIFGAILGLAGGLVAGRLYERDIRMEDAGRRRLAYTLVGGVVGAGVAMLLGIVPALLLAEGG